MGQLEYVKPRSRAEVLSCLLRYGSQGLILAGGTDLIRQMKEKNLDVNYLIDIKGVTEYKGITKTDTGWLEIGALTTINQLVESEEVKNNALCLWEGAKSIASPLVRNKATIGGNIGNSSPAADTAPPLIALGASLIIEGVKGAREVLVEDFFTGPSSNILGEDEFLTMVRIPPQGRNWSNSFIKHGLRNAQEISILSVAVNLELEEGVINDCRIAMGAVAPTPVRATSLEKYLKGRKATKETFIGASSLVAEDISPISDVRGSSEYRKKVSQNITVRALESALQRQG